MRHIIFDLLLVSGGCFLGITCMCLVISGKRFDREVEKLVAEKNGQVKNCSENEAEQSCDGGEGESIC